MGCCSSNQKVKNPNLANGNRPEPNTQMKNKPPMNQLQRNHDNKGTKISEKERVDTPIITEDNLHGSPLKDINHDLKNNSRNINGYQSVIKPQPQQKVKQYFDVSPKIAKKNKIYHITNVFPVTVPYSTSSQWQQILSKNQQMSEEQLAQKILALRNKNWIQDQIKLQIEIQQQSMASFFESLVTIRKTIQLREHFSWLIWSVAQYFFQQKNIDNTFNLPKINSRQWSEGFEYKGVYLKVLPYEEAYYVQNEMQALKYVQMELLELNSLSQQIISQYGNQKEKLHQDVILPLIAGVSCGGFFLYGTPVIYTQELDQAKEFYKENGMNASKVYAVQNSILQSNSVQIQAAQNQSNLSYSYLHNNISPDFIQDSLFKFLPILKNIGTKNMIPVIDFEEYNTKLNEAQKDDIELKYFLVHLQDILPRLSEPNSSSMLMKIPQYINDEITFHCMPQKNSMEVNELSKMLNSQSEQELNEAEEEDGNVVDIASFTKKMFSKHGWEFMMIEKKGLTNENKRSTNFYEAREVPIQKKKSENKEDNMLFIDEYIPKENSHEEGKKAQLYISQHKQSIFQRKDSQLENSNKIYGNALISAYNYKKDFRLKYSMNNHTFSTNIESLFSASIDQVAKIIEQSDNVFNSQSIKELFHRKGLNLRFQWVVLAKLRQNTQRDQLMVDILIRVMRRIINEEVKMKSKVQQPVVDAMNTTFEEYYQGNQIDNYKELVAFYMNTILKKKIQKNKQVFEESLLGLFISRVSILGIVYQLNLKKEEFFYLESKDILEDILDAPSRSPVYFMNAVQNYFKIEFKPEVQRQCRQDKHLFLSKSQTVSKNEIKQLQLKMHNYFTIREESYFILARQITNAQLKGSPNHKIVSKIKTKSEKDKIKQSFQKPKEAQNNISGQLDSSRNRGNTSGIGPIGLQSHHNSIIDNQDIKTNRVQTNQVIGGSKESLNTIRQYHNMDKAVINDSAEFSSRQNGQQKKTKQNLDQKLDFEKLTKRNNFKPTQVSEIILPSVLYKLKTFLSNNPMYYFDDSSKTYLGDTLTVFKSFYEMPNLDVVNEWVIILESQLKDVFTVNGNEQVLLEALVYQAMLIYFYKNDSDELLKVLQKIRDYLFITSYCSPECLIMIQVLTGMFFEEQKDQQPMEAEKSYLTAMMCIFQLYGDPRGRGNFTIPYSLYLSWKLSLMSLAEDKKLHDSEFAEEIFDASLKCLFNHKKHYKDQQFMSQINPKNLQQVINDIPNKLNQSKFDIDLERAELSRLLFDIKKYRKRPQNLTYASGLPKSSTIIMKSNKKNSKEKQEASVVYISSNLHFNEKKQNKVKANYLSANIASNKESLKSKSHIAGLKNKNNAHNEYDLDPSDIDLEIEDENQHFFIEENFKNNEWYIGVCPFQHWSLYRQQIAQILQAHNSVMSKNNQAQSQYQKQIYRDMLQKFLPKDLFYQWFLKFNPMMYQSGLQWSNEAIKNIIFCQNQQMISSSGSSVVMSSHHNLTSSHNSLSSSAPTSAKEKRNMHLGSYSQILGKEAGGINKQEMSGTLFSMGTDNFGQLGLDILTMNEQNHNASLKVLYPRMIVSLRDEIIKEICCGHSHTLVTNITGQVFVWGTNQTGQLGLGDSSPQFIRKPVLNPYLQNISKLSAGYEHSVAVTKNGELYTWGSGGLTGLGDQKQYNKPAKVEFFNKIKIAQAICGGLHTVAITKEGEIYTWGSTEGGQLGLSQQTLLTLCQGKEIPVSTPQKVPKFEGLHFTQVACGEAHSIAMTKDGALYGWGQSNYGQLGLGFSSDSFEPGIGMEKSKVQEPQEITGLKHERVQKIICGATFSLFQTDKGDLYGCGVNDLGQLGLDTFMEDMQIASLEKAKRGKHQQSTTDVTLPTKVICFQGIALHNIACGENHSLAVSGDGMNMLWAWGMYKNGQLGLGEVTMKMNPRPVQTLCSSLIQRIACGSMHSLALIGDSSQVSTYSSQYYASNETIKNHWVCDVRGLAKVDPYNANMQDDEVPDDGEGRVKNPK